MKFGSKCLAMLMAATAPLALAQNLFLSNPLDVDRTPEVVEVPLHQLLDQLHVAPAQAISVFAEDVASGQRVPSQLYATQSSSQPDRFLLLVQLLAHGTKRIAFRTDPHPDT